MAFGCADLHFTAYTDGTRDGARFLPVGFPGIRKIGLDSRALALPFGEKPSATQRPLVHRI